MAETAGMNQPMPDHANLAATRLRNGADGAVIVEADPELRVRLLDEAVRALGCNGACLRVGNPLRAPLTLERILFQIAGDETDLSLDGNAALLSRTLAQRGSNVLLAIDRADTLHLPVLHVLQQLMAGSAGSTRVQLLLAGDEGVMTLLLHSPLSHKLARLREQLGVSESLAKDAAENAAGAGPAASDPIRSGPIRSDPARPGLPRFESRIIGMPASLRAEPDSSRGAGPVPGPARPTLAEPVMAMRPVMLGSEPPPRLGWGDERPDFLPQPSARDDETGRYRSGLDQTESRPTLEQIRSQYPLKPGALPAKAASRWRWFWVLGLLPILLALAAAAWLVRVHPERVPAWDPAWPGQLAAVMQRGMVRARDWLAEVLTQLKQFLHRP